MTSKDGSGGSSTAILLKAATLGIALGTGMAMYLFYDRLPCQKNPKDDEGEGQKEDKKATEIKEPAKEMENVNIEKEEKPRIVEPVPSPPNEEKDDEDKLGE
eukprot:jgi/Bigna1/133864/aug1.23_g8572